MSSCKRSVEGDLDVICGYLLGNLRVVVFVFLVPIPVLVYLLLALLLLDIIAVLVGKSGTTATLPPPYQCTCQL